MQETYDSVLVQKCRQKSKTDKKTERVFSPLVRGENKRKKR